MKQDIFKIIIDKNFDFEKIIIDFPVIYEFKNVSQNPIYHKEGNVYNHTKNVCREILKLQEWNCLTNEEKVILYISALFHDIGKIKCTRIEDGEIKSPKHSIKGAKVFRILFYKEYSQQFEIDFKMREHICSLIKYHGLPLLFMEKENIEYNLIKASYCLNMKLLYLLSKADLLGREGENKEKLLDKVEYFKEYSKELDCFYHEKTFANEYTKFRYFNNYDTWYNNDIFDITEFDVIVMVGLPLSGKDTYIEKNYSNLKVVSLDNIRSEFNISPKKSSSKVVMIAKERAKEYLRSKQPFVWNATNITKAIRNNLCELFSSYNARVIFIYLEVPYDELLNRNNSRKRYIPENVLNNMIDKVDMIENTEGYKVEYHV